LLVNRYVAVGYGENSKTLALQDNSNSRFNKRNGSLGDSNDEHLGLEDLAPVAMLKIEALALDGLKIQAEMADQEAPYSVEPLADEANHKRVSQRGVPSVKSGNSAPDLNCAGEGSLMSSAVSLNEWMRLDAGECDQDDGEEQTVVENKDVGFYGKQNEKSRGKRHSASRGAMGDTVTLPMMALVQAERVRAPSKPTMGHRFSRRGFNEEEKEESVESPKFKIVDITVAGLETTDTSSPTRKIDIWNKPKQLAAGSRWVVAHGMAKSSSKSSMRSKIAAPVKVQRGESLWSISARVHGSGAKWRDSHIRNPNIIFADTSIRTY
jgi:hypothetical protein